MEVVCWADTQVHPIETEDHAIGLVRYANGAIGQFEVSWSFRGGLDLRDEIAGTEGTIFLNHWLRTGFEIFSAAGQRDYVAEKSESSQGWLFPVGDEPAALGYVDMFAEILTDIEEQREPMETFYDGLIVNCVMDAAYPIDHLQEMGADCVTRLARAGDVSIRFALPGIRRPTRSDQTGNTCQTGQRN